MRTLSGIFISLSLIGLVGCGGSNPGGGTGTLFVKASAFSDGSTENTALGVEVREGSDRGDLVTDAIVTIKGDKSGEFNLPWQGANFGNFKAGAYYKDHLSWDTGYALSVKRGNDNLDAYLVMPGITTITEPIAGTVFNRAKGDPLVVKWKDGEGRRAEEVNIHFDKADIDLDLAEDPMEREFEANRLTPTDHERLTVTRTNRIDLAGGTPGSYFSSQTTHRIEFRVE